NGGAQGAYGGIIRSPIAVDAEELRAGLAVRQVTRSAHETAAVIDAPVRETEHRDIAVGAERRIVREFRRVHPVPAEPVKRAADIARNLTVDFAVDDLALEAQSRKKIARALIAESLDHGMTPQRLPLNRSAPSY